MGGDSSAEAVKGDASEDDKDHEIANLRYQLRQSVQQQQVRAVICVRHREWLRAFEIGTELRYQARSGRACTEAGR